MKWIIKDKETGKITWIGNRPPRPGVEYTARGEPVPIPDQPVWLGDISEEEPPEGCVYVGIHYDEIPLKYSDTEILQLKAALIDCETASRINEAMHPLVPIEEQVGVIRNQIVEILNALGIKPTPEFARLNEIAIQAIEEGRQRKEELDAQSDSAGSGS